MQAQRVDFVIHYHTRYGEELFLDLFDAGLGKRRVPLSYTDGGVWRTTLLNARHGTQYAYTLVTDGRTQTPETGPLRTLDLTYLGQAHHAEIRDVWRVSA